ncbi:NACHT domain-containing protein [Chryseobacterium tongliaoense]|uniref:NACHT domain-containing protein n=1 Tax=Chryseobacterium tongliaoense TaxID=3240933 RepID=UPI003516F46B
MEGNQISAKGERAAIGGYLPQFDEFARFVYINLFNKTLSWIRVADPEAEKLDDILYSTNTEVHAYQIKWTIADSVITFKQFMNLFPKIFESWKKLKEKYTGKTVVPHLITNKIASVNDQIKLQDGTSDNFTGFITCVLNKIRQEIQPDKKWNNIIKLMQDCCTTEIEFWEFIKVFDFQHNYQQKNFSIQNSRYDKEEQDLTDLSRFIIEKVANPDRLVEFSSSQIINGLGWGDRFRTMFNHELIYTNSAYQPIKATIDELDRKFSEVTQGYLYLIGGPGSGKSTLLNQWSKTISEKVVKYYAFDFLQPSSPKNFYERGNAVNLFYDLVLQLKDAGIYSSEILPYKDIIFLKDIFIKQLGLLNEKFKTNGQKTVILIDGLDHVPREYQEVANTFLKELPVPDAIPDGVIFILGSQSFELRDIPQEIKKVFQSGERTVQMSSLTKEDVYQYIEALHLPIKFGKIEKDLIFEKSQGHPLYLTYIAGWLDKGESVSNTLAKLPEIDGNIENYYQKLWDPISNNSELIDLMGLIARINGSINTNFLQEWNFAQSVYKEFRDKAKALFNEENQSLYFFHNSFRQFLITETALNYFSNQLDPTSDSNYHLKLAELYLKSQKEKSWKANYHLFYAGDYNKFQAIVNSEHLTDQLLNFRPTEEVQQDAKYGIEIARRTKNISLLLRYLFCLSEIRSRLFTYNPSSFVEELLALNNVEEAVGILRNGTFLKVDNSIILKECRSFIERELISEAQLLYNLAQPDSIVGQSITLEDDHLYEEDKNSLEEWVETATYFEDTTKIVNIISHIMLAKDYNTYATDEPAEDLTNSLFLQMGRSIVSQSKWEDFEIIITKLTDSNITKESILLQLLKDAILKCLDDNDNNRAFYFLAIIKKRFPIDNVTNDYWRTYIADLIYRVTADLHETFLWIEQVSYPTTEEISKNLGYDDSLYEFEHQIRLNKLLNLCQKNKVLTHAIPDSEGDKEILVKFQRILFLITKIETDIIVNKDIDRLKDRILPIIKFYYRNFHPRNEFSYKLGKTRNETLKYLIDSISPLGQDAITETAKLFFDEFVKEPLYWSSDAKRNVINCLLINGLTHELAHEQLKKIEIDMLDSLDLEARFQECLSQARVYQLINNLEKSEYWLQQSCLQSFGVGYRKDYQYSNWIDWLKEINRAEPQGAVQRLSWFLGNLQHLKDTTEGRAYWKATEDILEAGLQYDLHTGLQILTWQLENGLIGFIESLRLLIKALLQDCHSKADYNMVMLFYSTLFLTVAKEETPELLKIILEKGYKILGEELFDIHLEDLVHKIRAKSFEADRHDFIQCIKKFIDENNINQAKIKVDLEVPPLVGRRADHSSTNNIVLKNPYRNFDEKTIISLVSDYKSLQEIGMQEDHSNSYFDWSNVINNVAPKLTIEEIKEISVSAKVRKRESGFYSNLSTAALNKGDKILAYELAEKSLELSGESGWSVGYDGGSRINAFKALRKINPKQASDKAFEIFCQDVLASTYPTFFVSELSNIVPLLSENIVLSNIWNEVFDYVKRLMINSKVSSNIPKFDDTKIDISQTMVDYLLYIISLPIPFLQESIKILLAEYIHQKNSYTIKIFKDKKVDLTILFDVIQLLFEQNSPTLTLFIEELKSYCLSSNLEHRIIARRILIKIGENIPIPPAIAIPGIYSLHLIHNPNASIYRNEAAYNPEEDLFRPFNYLIRILASTSQLPEQNIKARIVSIKKENATKSNRQYKLSEIKNLLNDLELNYAFINPELSAIRNAVMITAGELIDCQLIDEKEISKYFELADTTLSYFPEEVKPKFIHSTKEDEYGGVKNKWIERLSETSRLNETIASIDQNFILAAEHSVLKNLGWDVPTEIFMSQISHQQDSYNFGTGNIYETMIVNNSNDYFNLTDCGNSIIIKRAPTLNFSTNKANWIAVNPSLAKKLGWRPAKQLFSWENKNKEIIAKSVYWIDGNVEMSSRYDGEVGDGWYVCFTANALEQLKKEYPQLFIQKKIIRFSNKDIDEIEITKKLF